MAAWPEASHCFGVTGLRPRPPRRLRLWVRNWLAKDPGLGMAASARRAARWRTDRAISSLASWNKRQQLSKLYIHCWTYKAKLYKTRNIFIKKLCFNVDYKSEIAFHFFFQLFSTPKKKFRFKFVELWFRLKWMNRNRRTFGSYHFVLWVFPLADVSLFDFSLSVSQVFIPKSRQRGRPSVKRTSQSDSRGRYVITVT